MNAPVTPDLAGFRAQAAEQGRRVVSVHTRLFADDPLPLRAAIFFPMQGCLVELPLA